MEPSIDVRCSAAGAGWTCHVTVTRDRTAMAHEVTLTVADLARLAPGAASPDDVVRRSFEFLLAREPPQSILRRFDLPLIGRYFPEYEGTIRRG